MDELPTLENYGTELIMKKWPPSRCKERLAQGFKGRATCQDGKTEIQALLRKFEHLKMLHSPQSQVTGSPVVPTVVRMFQ
jgi:hypothetical protein